jgi:hypothetical protein
MNKRAISIQTIAAAMALSSVVLAGSADAKGAIKGAAKGAVVGHVLGHHAKAGAVIGAVHGHHQAAKQARHG